MRSHQENSGTTFNWFIQNFFPLLNRDEIKNKFGLESIEQLPSSSRTGKIFKIAFAHATLQTFIQNGYDPIKKTYNDKPISELPDNEFYNRFSKGHKHWLVTLAVAFGISSRNIISSERKPDYVQFLKNMLGWQPKGKTQWLNYTIVFPILALSWNIIEIVAKSLWNRVKFATELLPLFFSNLAKIAFADLLSAYNQSDSKLIRFSCAFAMMLTGLAFLAFKLAHVIGRSITAPRNSISAAWKTGNSLGGTVGKMVGLCLVALSIISTISLYAVFFPLSVKCIIASLISCGLKSTLPFCMSLESLLAKGGVLPTVGKFLDTTVAKPFVKLCCDMVKQWSIHSGSTVNYIGSGLAFLITTIGTFFQKIQQKAANVWYDSKQKLRLNRCASFFPRQTPPNLSALVSNTPPPSLNYCSGSWNK